MKSLPTPECLCDEFGTAWAQDDLMCQECHHNAWCEDLWLRIVDYRKWLKKGV